MNDALLTAVNDGVDIYDLGHPLYVGMPKSPDHPEFRMVLQRRHGDKVRGDGSSGANELIITGGHVGTHIDALSHISFRGQLHDGADASSLIEGRFASNGAEHIPPLVRRALLLDIAALLGVERCDAGSEITVEQLEAALEKTGAQPKPGDVILIRTGWGALFGDVVAFQSDGVGHPGPGAEAGQWLAGWKPVAVGSDTIPFERIPPGTGNFGLPVHKLLIVESGIHIIEQLDLEALSASGHTVFTLVLSPLKLMGATGSPVRPLAIVPSAG